MDNVDIENAPASPTRFTSFDAPLTVTRTKSVSFASMSAKTEKSYASSVFGIPPV